MLYGSIKVYLYFIFHLSLRTYPSEGRHLGHEHAGREPEGVTVAATVRELDDLGGQDEVPAQLGQIHRQRGETAAALTRLTLRLTHGSLGLRLGKRYK